VFGGHLQNGFAVAVMKLLDQSEKKGFIPVRCACREVALQSRQLFSEVEIQCFLAFAGISGLQLSLEVLYEILKSLKAV
jgi:hypothetical protein